jgi:HSP20 family protein
MLAGFRFPLAPFTELRREMDRLFDNFGQRDNRSPLWQACAYPALSIWDAGEALCVEAEVPGIPKENLEVYAVGKELTIKGRRPALEERDTTHHRHERITGEFARVVTLPVEVESDKVEATLKDGVLSLRLPKAQSAKPRKITVKSN